MYVHIGKFLADKAWWSEIPGFCQVVYDNLCDFDVRYPLDDESGPTPIALGELWCRHWASMNTYEAELGKVIEP